MSISSRARGRAGGNRRTFPKLFWRAWRVLRILAASEILSEVAACPDAGAWNVLQSPLGTLDPLSMPGMSRRVEHAAKIWLGMVDFRSWQWLRRAVTLEHGASLDFFGLTASSVFAERPFASFKNCAGAPRVLRILLGIVDLSRWLRHVRTLVHGASSEFCLESSTHSVVGACPDAGAFERPADFAWDLRISRWSRHSQTLVHSVS